MRILSWHFHWTVLGLAFLVALFWVVRVGFFADSKIPSDRVATASPKPSNVVFEAGPTPEPPGVPEQSPSIPGATQPRESQSGGGSRSGSINEVLELARGTPDADFEKIRERLRNPAESPEVLQIFFEETLARPNETKLPALIEILKIPGHPLVQEATTLLQIYIGRDVGDDPAAWEAAVRSQLHRDALDKARAEGSSEWP